MANLAVSRPESFGKIILLGDSLTEMSFITPGGLGLALARLYGRKMDVVNRGMSGYNTTWALNVVKRIFPPTPSTTAPAYPPLVCIWFGANDSTLPFSPQSVPLSLFKNQISEMMAILALHAPDAKFLLLTTPPVDLAKWGAVLESKEPGGRMDREVIRTKMYANAVMELGEESGTTVVDVYGALTSEAERCGVNVADFLDDGLHLNERGYGIVFSEVKKMIAAKLPELDASAIPDVFAEWRDNF